MHPVEVLLSLATLCCSLSVVDGTSMAEDATPMRCCNVLQRGILLLPYFFGDGEAALNPIRQ